MYKKIGKRGSRQFVIALLFLFLVGGSMQVWGQLPYGCNYEIDVGWNEKQVREYAKNHDNAIVYSGDGNQAIVVKKSAKYWVRGGSNGSLRIMVDGGDSPTLCLDGANIAHGKKVPIWISNRSKVRINIAANSSFKASGEGDAGIQVEPGCSLSIYEESGTSGGTLTLQGGSGGAGVGGTAGNASHGDIKIYSGNINSSGNYAGPAIGPGSGGVGNIHIYGGTVTASFGYYGIGGRGSSILISGGNVTSYTGIRADIMNVSGTPTINSGVAIYANALTIGGTPTITTNGIEGSDLTIQGGTIISTDGISSSKTAISGGTVTTTSSVSSAIRSSLTLSGGVVRATGASNGLDSGGTTTITGGELYLKGGTADMHCSTLNMQGGYVRLEGSAKSLNTGTYNFTDGTLVTVNKFATATSCGNFTVQGGSVIVNSPPITSRVFSLMSLILL